MTDINYHPPSDKKTIAEDEFLNDLVNDTLLDLAISSFNELVRCSGTAKALETIKPFMKQVPSFVRKELSQRNLLKGNGPDTLLFCWMWGGLSVTEKTEGEIRERGAVGYSHNCVFKNGGSPEQCIAISHFPTTELCEQLNPDYECIWTHHETDGDPYCRYIFKRKSDPIDNLDDLGKTLMIMPKIPMTKEDSISMRHWALSNYVWMNTEAFLSIHGSERTVEILGANARKIGKKVGEQLNRHNKEMEKNPMAVGQMIDLLGKAMSQKGTIANSSIYEFSKEITECPSQVLLFETCKQYESLFQGVCEAINPDLEFCYDRIMTRGDKTCHWVVRKKEEPRGEKLKEEALMDDPIKMLTMMYVKGEITEEEYQKKMDIIKKYHPG